MDPSSISEESVRREDLAPEKQIMVLRIVVAAMAMGALVFGAIVAVVIGPGDNGDGTLTTVGLIVALVVLVLHRVAGSLVFAANTRDLPEEEEPARRQLMAARIKSTFVSGAMLEGGAFLNLMVYGFIDGQPISLAMAGLLWLGMLLHFPLPGSLEGWMDNQLRNAREQRSLRPAK
ncbi:MAG: hypothetical protein AAF589_02365 [Planctomycetota bacterium]